MSHCIPTPDTSSMEEKDDLKLSHPNVFSPISESETSATIKLSRESSQDTGAIDEDRLAKPILISLFARKKEPEEYRFKYNLFEKFFSKYKQKNIEYGMLDIHSEFLEIFEAKSPISSPKKETIEKEIDYDSIIEPENFYISTNFEENLFIDSIDDVKTLLDDIKNVKYDEKLAKFFANYNNDIEDLTE